jgi:hypothetical protein
MGFSFQAVPPGGGLFCDIFAIKWYNIGDDIAESEGRL